MLQDVPDHWSSFGYADPATSAGEQLDITTTVLPPAPAQDVTMADVA